MCPPQRAATAHRVLQRALAALAVSFGLLGAAGVQAQTCGIAGMSGNSTLTTGSPNTYVPPSASAGAGSTAISLVTASAVGATPIAVGDRVLVIQMQDSVGALEGNFEYATVTSIAGATHNLAAPLVNSYAQSVGATQLQTFQVIRVPQYANLTVNGTISPPAWTIDANGRGTGGVLAVDVSGVLTMGAAGVIDASGRGFRGAFGINGAGNRAAGTTSLDANYTPALGAMNGALKGEGVNGVPNQLFTGVALPVVYTQGLYGVGTAGQAASGNAGGGGNDGTPPTGNNQYNSGGGGGGGYGAGGNGGNNWDNGSPQTAAGGRGGSALPSSNAKAYFGGGGGAGSANNNAVANAVTTYPPFSPTTNPNTVNQANGAAGPVSLSGAVGGGIVMVQAGTIAATAGAAIRANGFQAYATSGGTEGAGGGGGGGTILVYANSATGTLAASATGGRGGDSNNYNHGPGGGGGGGYIGTSAGVALATSLGGGANGLDATNGGGNVADAYGSTPGTGGLAQSLAAVPGGTRAGAQCAPVLTVSKTAITPVVTATTAAIAQYNIVVSNAATAGAARNVEIIDNALPPGWTLAAAPTYAYSPAGPAGANNFASGADTATDVAGYSINASPTAAPTVVPTVGSNSMTWSSLFIAPGGAATVTFSVNVPDTARVGTYHNPAGVRFADFTSNTGKVSPLLQNTANRAGTSYGATAYASGASVGGSNYSGLEAGPVTDDVQLLPDLSVTKTGPAQLTAGAVFSYLLTPRNSGRAIGTQTFATTQATTVAQANVPAVLGSSPLRVTDTLPAAITTTGAPTGTNWTCSVSGSTVTCDYFQATPASAYPLAGQADLPVITIPARLVQSACGASVTNTAVISAAAGETGLANNTSTSVISSNCQSTVTISKISAGTSVAAGGTTSYTITVANLGPSSADGAVLADPAVAGLLCTAATCTGSGGAVCTSPTPAVSLVQSGLTIPTLPAQSQVVVTLACSVTATGQ